jgi:hypothetical protein
VTLRLASILSLSALTLSACLGNSGSPAQPPTNVQAFPGDGAVSVTWDSNPQVQYWLFYAQDPKVTPYDLDNGTAALLNFGYVVPVYSPITICNGAAHTVVNQSLAAGSNYPALYFTLNGRTGTAKGGPGSAPVSAMPRPAGAGTVPWVSGNALQGSASGNAVNALGYVPMTTCGYGGNPPHGLWFAVGDFGAIYRSTLAPTVAGPLTNPGNLPMNWTPATTPAGFSASLRAVIGRSAGINVPGNTTVLVVAVGDAGAILYSLDGANWQHSGTGVTGANLRDVTLASAGFIAVGDGGVVLTSGDGINWSLNSSAQTANPLGNTLRAVHCAGNTCVAVGDNGTTLWTSNGGGNWTLVPFGTNNWTSIAYGGADANSDQLFSATPVVYASGITVNGSYNLAAEAINTWVVADALGNYGYADGDTGGSWVRGPAPIAPNIVAIDYTTGFLALDSSGNAWYNERGTTGAWVKYGAPLVATNGAQAVSLRSNGQGYVAIGSTGLNAASF